MKLKGQLEIVDKEQDLKLQINRFFQVNRKSLPIIGQSSVVGLFEEKSQNMEIKISTLNHRRDVLSMTLDLKFQQVFPLIPQKDRKSSNQEEPLKLMTIILMKA